MPPQYPQTMLRVAMRRSAELLPPTARLGFAEEAKDIQRRHGSRQAITYLLEKLGLEASVDRDEGYYAEAMHFHLGLLEAYADRPEAMAEHIRLSRTMPCAEDDRLFADHVAISKVAHAHQQAAIGRKMPAAMFACMPRSASATLTYSLAKLLDGPVLHTSIGPFPDYFIAPSWLDMFLEGGAVTQDHLMLNDFNFGVLKGRGPRDIFVTIRDPRAAARSQVHWLARWGKIGSASVEERIEHQCVDRFIPWLQSWIERSRDPTSPLRIHMINFADIVHDLAGTIRKIVEVLANESPAMAAFASRAAVEEIRIHFNQGDDDAWRAEVDAATRRKLWDACTPDIKALLMLAP